MKSLLISLLALAGLSNALAFPAADTASATIAPSCLTVLCPFPLTPVLDPVSRACNCVPPEPYPPHCLVGKICKKGYHPAWNALKKTCVCEKDVIIPDETTCLAATTCIIGSSPFWNARTKTCTCIANSDDEPEKFRLFKRDGNVDPATCLDVSCGKKTLPVYHPELAHCVCEENAYCLANTICISEMHGVWNPEIKGCECQWIPGLEPPVDPSACPTIKCTSTTHPVYNPKTKTCTCKKNKSVRDNEAAKVDPKTCSTTKCPIGTVSIYNPKTKTCICKKDRCYDTICISEMHGVWNTTAKACECEWLPGFEPEPEPPKCHDWVCIAEQEPVYNEETGRCGCQWIPGLEPISTCAEIMCIAEMIPMFNTTTGECECEWIPGLEPKDESGAPHHPPFPVCAGTICISEMHGVWNATSHRCECEWINGFGPGTPIKREVGIPTVTTPPLENLSPLPENAGLASAPTVRDHCKLLKIYCQYGDHHMHWDPRTQSCICPAVEPIETSKPVQFDCRNLLIYCEAGDHFMQWDEELKRCACPKE